MIDRPCPPCTLYRLFGVAVASDIDLNLDAGGRGDIPGLRIQEHHGAFDRGTIVLDSPYRCADGEGRYRVSESHGRVVLEISPYAVFRIGPRSIEYCRLASGSPAGLKLLLTGVVAAVWAEVRGWPTLHGAAVQVGPQAAVFLAPSRVGKSSFAGAWVRAGHQLITDDQVVVQSLAGVMSVAPGPPQLKVSALLARFLGVEFEGLPPLHPNIRKRQFPQHRVDSASGIHPIAAVFVLRRSAVSTGNPTAERLFDANSILPLLRNGYSPQTVEALGLHTARLTILAKLAQDVPVWRLTYPSGYAQLGGVKELAAQCLATRTM